MAKRRRSDEAKHMPTADEIARECERIRGEWTAAERLRRSRWALVGPVELMRTVDPLPAVLRDRDREVIP